MPHSPAIHDTDVDTVTAALKARPETPSVTQFRRGPGLTRLDLDATRAALNGGEQHRVHLVAALAYEQVTE